MEALGIWGQISKVVHGLRTPLVRGHSIVAFRTYWKTIVSGDEFRSSPSFCTALWPAVGTGLTGGTLRISHDMTFHLSFCCSMQGVVDLGLSVLTRVQGLSCPLYCGNNNIPAFLAGLSSGILLGSLLTLWIVLQVWTSANPTYRPGPPVDFDAGPRPRGAASCLAGYLHD